MSLQTPDKIRSLQSKLYLKAKAEPGFRFGKTFAPRRTDRSRCDG